jgi:hypothetical protein
MDGRLTRVACQHLHFFVEICDRTLKLKQRRVKVKAFMKQLFLDDDGVQDLLVQMKNLVDKEHGLVAAQTFRSSNEAAVNSRDNLSLAKKADTKLDSLVEEKNQQKREVEMKKRKQVLIKALEFDQADIDDNTQEPKEKWETLWRRHKEQVVDGTGEWVDENPLFTSWRRGSASAKPILCFEGEDSTGKTLLAANIIMSLRKPIAGETSRSRSAIAYYFHEKNSKATFTKTIVASTVSKTLLWQLAKTDEPFMKSVAGICEKAIFKNHQEM